MSLSQPSNPAALRRTSGQSSQNGSVTDLQNTIARFQATLTDDDRKKLQCLKGSSHDAQSIITFTADLDRLDSNRRGKSVASRLASFLQIIEQFSPIVDTYIQANPDITALIWGSVKLTFLVLANFTSYFQSFVELLGGFGSLCERFSEYQLLFTESQRLQNSICSFHSAVITCCEKIVAATRRPLRTQAWKAVTQSFQAEIRSYVENIRSKAKDVREDLRLAKAQSDEEEKRRQATERQEAASSRQQLTSWISMSKSEVKSFENQARRQAADKRRRRLLKDLSCYNFTAPFNNARNKRHLGTAEWILDTREFQDWHTSHQSAVLHITGKIGSGKTILTARVVEHLCQTRQPNQFTSFFFSRFDDVESLTSDTIIRSLVYQLLSMCLPGNLDPLLISELLDCLEEAKDNFLSLKQLSQLFVKSSILVEDWFIILDGLDECHIDEQGIVYGFLSRILGDIDRANLTKEGNPTSIQPKKTPAKLKILFSGRDTTVAPIARSFPSASLLVTGSNHTSKDIVAYAEDVIKDKQLDNKLIVKDSRLIEEILDVIMSKEEGMFLWVFLTIEDICSRKSDNEIRNALQDIPTDLPATFDRALNRIVQQRHQDAAKDIFRWTAAVHRPLTLSQLREALSVKIAQKRLNQSDLINGIERINVWCENLIQVEESDDTVHFSHNSIKEYLLKPDAGEFENFHFTLDACDKHITEICITYLNLDDFCRALVLESEPASVSSIMDIPVEGIAEKTLQHAVKGKVGARMGRLVSRVVRSTSQSTSPNPSQYSVPIYGLSSETKGSVRLTEYPFLEYATENWYKHKINLAKDTDIDSWRLLGRILVKPPLDIQWPWMDPVWASSAMESSIASLEACNPTLVRFIRDELSRDPSLSMRFSIIFYGYQHENPGLICHAVARLARQKGLSHQFMMIYLFLAIKANHFLCLNRCLTFPAHWDHETQIAVVAECIEAGIESWPIDPSDAPPCICFDCERGVDADICKILSYGYHKQSQPYLQAFVKVASPNNPSLTFKQLCEDLTHEPLDLFSATTVTGKSILEIAAERPDRALFVDTFFEHFEPDLRQKWENSNPAVKIGAFCAAIRSGAVVSIERLSPLTAASRWLSPELDDGVFDAISTRLGRLWWSQEVAKNILSTWLGDPVSPRLSKVREMLFLEALLASDWRCAIILARLEPMLADSRGKVSLVRVVPGSEYLVRAFCCNKCHISLDDSQETQSFKMCRVHRNEGEMEVLTAHSNQPLDYTSIPHNSSNLIPTILELLGVLVKS